MKANDKSIIVFDLSKGKEIINLSLEAQGLFSCMINNPEYDYATINELHRLLPDSVSSIACALDELVNNGLLNNLNGKFAVNKKQLVSNMRCISLNNCKGVVCNV